MKLNQFYKHNQRAKKLLIILYCKFHLYISTLLLLDIGIEPITFCSLDKCST